MGGGDPGARGVRCSFLCGKKMWECPCHLEYSLSVLSAIQVQYCPNFFFGALLVWFGVDIVSSWMISSFWKLSRAEYILLWATFIAIMWLGLEAGIGIGIVFATLYFTFEYAQVGVCSGGGSQKRPQLGTGYTCCLYIPVPS